MTPKHDMDREFTIPVRFSRRTIDGLLYNDGELNARRLTDVQMEAIAYDLAVYCEPDLMQRHIQWVIGSALDWKLPLRKLAA